MGNDFTMRPKVLCSGSGERSGRVHLSDAIVCPSCNGAYPSSDFTVPDHLALAEDPVTPDDRFEALCARLEAAEKVCEALPIDEIRQVRALIDGMSLPMDMQPMRERLLRHLYDLGTHAAAWRSLPS